MSIPKFIWIYWEQGIDNAPTVVSRCVNSWIKQNPSWDVIVLSKSTLPHRIDVSVYDSYFSNLCSAHQSDIIRLQLLKEFGGVWVDATTFCNYPLDEWIEPFTRAGVFFFQNPAPDRLISNWFIISEKGNPLLTKMLQELVTFWEQFNFSKPNRFQIWLSRLFNRVLTGKRFAYKIWISMIPSKMLGIYPYFIFHYLFEQLVRENRDIKSRFQQIPFYSAHKILQPCKLGLNTPINAAIIKRLSPAPPLYKLSWRVEKSESSLSILEYIISLSD